MDAIEAVAAKYAADWPAWGHRKIVAMLRADGHQLSTFTVQRALRRRGLLLPTSGQTADRGRGRGSGCSETHHASGTGSGRWTSFEFETARGGIWRICAIIDDATKYCLAATVTPTSWGQDALGCLRRAVVEAEQVLDLGDLGADRGVMDAVVTDNGPCFRGVTFADAFAGDDPLFRHLRTRVRSPQTNGVVVRFFGTLKYEHRYRATIGALAVEANLFHHTDNTLRPHQALDERAPRAAYLAVEHCDERVAVGGPAI